MDAVWCVVRDRAEREATNETPVKQEVDGAGRPNVSRASRRPDLNRCVLPGAGKRIGQVELGRALRQYLHDELTDMERRRVPDESVPLGKRNP